MINRIVSLYFVYPVILSKFFGSPIQVMLPGENVSKMALLTFWMHDSTVNKITLLGFSYKKAASVQNP